MLELVLLTHLIATPPEVAPIDLGTASVLELQRLPGVGPKTAAAIVAKRPYRRVRDLLRVKGIGRKRLARLAPFVKVTRPPRPVSLRRARRLACFPRRRPVVRVRGCRFVGPRGVWTPP